MKTKYCVMLLIILLSTNAFAMERKKIGIGVIAGDPTGITSKLLIDTNSAIDAGIGWKTSGDNELHIYGDYLYYWYDVFEVKQGMLPLYFGGGIRFINREDNDDKLGIRMPIGIEYIFENVLLRAFLEMVPVLNFTPNTDFDLDAGIGIRLFF